MTRVHTCTHALVVRRQMKWDKVERAGGPVVFHDTSRWIGKNRTPRQHVS